MRKILIGVILGGILAFVSMWILDYFPSKSKYEPSTDLDALMHKFANKTLIYWTEDVSCEIYLYGEIALIRSWKGDSPRKEFDYNEARAIWDQFERLPGLVEFKNPDPDTVRPRSTHKIVFVTDPAGMRLSPHSSYSIPKDEAREEYRLWLNLIDATVRKHLGEQAAALNGP